MPPESDDALSEVDQLRLDLCSWLTHIQGQTQLLQRQVRRMDGFSDGDRQRLEAGLAMILASTRALGAKIDDVTAITAPRDER